jgi:hypothetical protein
MNFHPPFKQSMVTGAAIVLLAVLILSACSNIAATPSQVEPTPRLPEAHTPTAEPQYQPPIITIPSDHLATMPALQPPHYDASGVADRLEGLSEQEIELLQAEQWLRLYQWEKGMEGQAMFWTDEAAYLEAMQAFARSQSQVHIHQRQANDGAVITWLFDANQHAVFWGVSPNGALAYPEPQFYNENTRLAGIRLPEGLVPDFGYNPDDKHWYLFGVDGQGRGIVAFITHQATVDNQQSSGTLPRV